MKIETILKASKSLNPSKKTVISLIYTASELNYVFNNVLKPYDISIQQFNVLRILRGQKGLPVSLQTVQERMITKMSNTTRLIDKLILKGYVNKEINKTNKRKINVMITQSGLHFLETIDPIIDATEKNATKELTLKELKELNRLLEKIRLIAN